MLSIWLAWQAPGMGPGLAQAIQARLRQADAIAAAPLYQADGWRPLWVTACAASPQARALMQALSASGLEGLNPGDYGARLWPQRASVLGARCASAAAVADFDVAFTVSVERYVADVHDGRYNPDSPVFAAVVADRRLDLGGFVRALAEASGTRGPTAPAFAPSGDVPALLRGLEPQYEGYQRTRTALGHYLQLAAAGDGPPVPAALHPVHPGEAFAGASALAQRLRQLGDLAAASELAPGDAYPVPLAAAVRHFQRRHGLEPDGILGPRTVRALNRPLAGRVLALRLALERWRWLPPRSGADRIVVNLPEFRLRAFAQGQQVLTMRVIAGQALNHQTPELASSIQSVIFRPYWNVPLSIVRHDLVPEIRRHPDYLAANHFDLLTAAGEAAGPMPEPDELKALTAGAIEVRQRPGPENSLGLIKFDFPNCYDVYLHDTPAKSLFEQPRGDFSHGCIRLEQPAGLAAFLLRDQPQWTPAAIAAAMQSGPDARPVRLTHPVQVLVIYRTAWVEADGTVDFFDDIYGRDRALAALMAAAR